jgi:hypothetical protein
LTVILPLGRLGRDVGRQAGGDDGVGLEVALVAAVLQADRRRPAAGRQVEYRARQVGREVVSSCCELSCWVKPMKASIAGVMVPWPPKMFSGVQAPVHCATGPRACCTRWALTLPVKVWSAWLRE